MVVYSRTTPTRATRVWVDARGYFGFDDVSVPDGGLEAWRQAGLPLESGSHEHPGPVRGADSGAISIRLACAAIFAAGGGGLSGSLHDAKAR